MRFTVLLIIVLSGFTMKAIAQGFVNEANLFIESGVVLSVDTDFENKPGGDIYNDSEIRVSGDFDNTGNPVIDELVVFYGNGIQSVTGETDFIDVLEVDKSGGLAEVTSGTSRVHGILRLNEGVIDAGGNLVIASNASGTGLVDDFSDIAYDGQQIGSLRVQRYVGVNPGFHYIGSAVNSASLSELSEFGLYGPDGGQVVPLQYCDPNGIAETSPYGAVFEWREDANWLYNCDQSGWFVRSSGNMVNARGYAAITPFENYTFEIGGSEGNTSEGGGSNIVSYDNLENNGNPLGNGWNLVSNPFPSPMQWQAPPPGFDAQIAFWQTSGPYQGTYQSFIANPTNPNLLIGSQQGFFVRVSGASADFSLDQSYRRLGDPAYYKEDLENTFDIVVEGEGFADKTRVRFGDDGETNGFDSMLDANKLKARGAQPTLQTRYRGVEYSINSLSLDNYPMTIPMDLLPGISGEFAFTAKYLDMFTVEAHVYLEDLRENTIQELTINPVYEFHSDESDDPERFLLHFRLDGDDPMYVGDEILMYAHDHNAFVFLPELDRRAELEVFNALGDLVYQTTDLYEGKNEINLSNLATGAYILRATVNDEPIIRKVIL